MRRSDWLVDMGPGAGLHGGEIVAEGPAAKVERVAKSVTGQFLAGKRSIVVPERRDEDRGSFVVRGAAQHNLKEIDVEFPVGKFVCVTGVSGSGKSTLVNEIVFKALANRLNRARVKPGAHAGVEGIDVFDKVIEIDQKPIGRTPRSNPATYTDLFTHIRELYSLTPEAKIRGYRPGRFSFNVRGGRCETCKGDGQIKIEMHFLPDVYVPCETCKGARYNRETLEVRFKGSSIADVLEMSVEEALRFFAKIPKIRRRLQTLHDVGLDYIKLGQPATTLSGGEAQRVKLAAELSKIATGKTLYILDEPTTGLHFADIEKLLETLQRLVDGGNTMIVIEHNLDVIKQADWVVDLGPEGGEEGGELVASGTPEEVARVEGSFTGSFLRHVLPAARPPRERRPVGMPSAGDRPLVGARAELVAASGRRARRAPVPSSSRCGTSRTPARRGALERAAPARGLPGSRGSPACSTTPVARCRSSTTTTCRSPYPDLGSSSAGLRMRSPCTGLGRRAPLRRGAPARRARQLPAGPARARARVGPARARRCSRSGRSARDLRRGSLPHRRQRLGAGRPDLRRAALCGARLERAAARRRHPRACTAGAGGGALAAAALAAALPARRARDGRLVRLVPASNRLLLAVGCALERGLLLLRHRVRVLLLGERRRCGRPPRRRRARRGSRAERFA